jgi:methionyl-tRNA synthetase
MFICTDCGRIFDEPITWQERHGLDTPPYETFSGCPYCREPYERAVECEVCGEYFAESELTDGVCDNCVVELEDE